MSQSHYNNSGSGEGGSGNMWSGGSRGGNFGSRGGFSRSNDDDDDHQGSSGERSYRGSYGNKYSSGGGSGGGSSGGSYGFRRDGNQSRGDMEIQKDTIFIQDLPRDITREQINDAFSTVGPIKVDDRSGGPKIWIYKDRNTDEPNGRATVTYEDDDTANRAIQKYHDQHIDSIGAAVRVQLAQRRPRNNDRGGFGGNRGYRGGRSTWDSNNSRQGFGSDGNRWESFGRGGGGGGFRGRSDGGDGGGSFQDSGDRDRSYRSGGSSSSSGQYRGASRGRGGSSNYAPY